MTYKNLLLLTCVIAVGTGTQLHAGMITSGLISGHHHSSDPAIGGRIDYTATGEDERTLTSFSGTANSTHTARVTTDGLKSRLTSDFSGFSSVLAGVIDTYTITGGIPGETINLNAVFHIEGYADIPTGNIGGTALISASIGYGLDANANTTGGNPVIAGGSVFSPYLAINAKGVVTPFAFDVIAPLTVESGTAFQLSFGTRIFHSKAATTDMLNTASVSFELADGYEISSVEGFGTSSSETTAVPEPTSFALLGIGCLSMFGYRLRRPQHVDLTA